MSHCWWLVRYATTVSSDRRLHRHASESSDIRFQSRTYGRRTQVLPPFWRLLLLMILSFSSILPHTEAFFLGHRRRGVSVRKTFENHFEEETDPAAQALKHGIARQAATLALVVVMLSPGGFAIPDMALASDTTNLLTGRRYWDVQEHGSVEERIKANTALMDYTVGTVNTMYYDHSGGIDFDPRNFWNVWRLWMLDHKDELSTRQGVVDNLHKLIDGPTGVLGDPYAKYLTREDLRAELSSSDKADGFLGLGCVVESASAGSLRPTSTDMLSYGQGMKMDASAASSKTAGMRDMDVAAARKLPLITAIAPNSPAERAGLVVGDVIVAVGSDPMTDGKLAKRYNAANYLGHPTLTVAKPIFTSLRLDIGPVEVGTNSAAENEGIYRDVIRAYRPTRVKLPTMAAEPYYVKEVASPSDKASEPAYAILAGGDQVVQYQILTDSIFGTTTKERVGYIRLTRFSRASTAGFYKAVEALETGGASSYIIDLRNNYGGVIQEAMLTAASLLRDPHVVICYTMNSRGGFTPHDVEEYVVDTRYSGYLLSREPKDVVAQQVRREHPEYFDLGNWSPMSSYASLREQQIKRGIHRPSSQSFASISSSVVFHRNLNQLVLQKNIVVLINEGTASAAEVFASALHDNGRTVALVGSKSFGKGLIQHTFPLPDGGGLRLTVAEYLTPALHHVSNVGGAQFDRVTGEWFGGGIRPDVICESRHGIPSRVGADFCIGIALDELQDAKSTFRDSNQLTVKRTGGSDDGSKARRAVTVGINKDDF